MTHKLKILPVYFREVESGNKKFELRIFDRPFSVGDELILREWDGFKYTGRAVRVLVTYMLPLRGIKMLTNLKEDWVILSISVLEHYRHFEE